MTRELEREDAAQPSLGGRAIRGVLVTLGGQWGRTLLQTASTILLARVLSPKEFGLLAMVVAVVGVADLVREFGLSGAIVQRKTIDDSLWRSVLWLSAALGVASTLVVAASAPLVAALYGDPRLVLLTLVLSPSLLLNSLSMPLQVKLQRELRFRSMASLDVVSMLVGVIGAVIAALLGAGVWSLVVLNGLGALYRLGALWVLVRPRFGRPGIRREVMPLVSSGGSIFGVQLLNYAARNLDNVLVGRTLGADVLGQYSRAYSLLMLPLSQLNGPLARVALPILSRLQDEPDRYRRYIRTATLLISYVSIPVLVVGSAVAQPLVVTLLGEQWRQAGLLFSLLTIAGAAQAFGNVQGWLYVSLGRTHRQLLYYVISRPIVIASFFVGLAWNGVAGLALLYGLVSMGLLVPGFAYAVRGTPVRLRDVFAPAVRPLLVSPFAWAAAAAVVVQPLPDPIRLVLGTLAGVSPFLLATVLPPYRRDITQLVSTVRQVRSR